MACGCGRAPTIRDGADLEFELDLLESRAAWSRTKLPRTQEHVNFLWDDEALHTDGCNFSIAIGMSHPQEKIAYNWTRTIDECEAGGKYELCGWIKTERLKEPAWICVQSWDRDMKKMIGFATTQMKHPVAGTRDWTKVSTVFKVPRGTHEVRVRAGIGSPENRGGRAWFYGLKVRRLI